MSKRNLSRDSSEGSLTRAEIEAASRTNFPVEGVIDARLLMKEIAMSHEKRVQYWALMDDSVWTSQNTHIRLFMAVRLLLEYQGARHDKISERETRMIRLKELANRLASDLPEVLPEGPVLLGFRSESQPAPAN